MSEISLFYREAAPSPELAQIVAAFWEFAARGENAEIVTHTVFPDGCVSLFYYRNETQQKSDLLISHLSLESKQIPVCANDVYWAMRISPTACRAFLRAAPETLPTMPAIFLPALTNFVPKLKADLDACQNFSAAIKVFEKFARAIGFEADEIDERLVSALQYIEENKAQVKIDETAEHINLSVRQFERLFRRASGLTPKQYVRARRIRQTAIDLVENSQANWAARAAEMGFTDQAHLAHELSAVTNDTPVVFAEKIKRIKHGLLVK